MALHIKDRPGFTLIELLVVLSMAILLAAIALPHFMRMKERGMEAEVKANLHRIQLETERYAVDTRGSYPLYLIGGAGRWSAEAKQSGGAVEFLRQQDCPDPRALIDPLLAGGYLSAYPANPFARSGLQVHLAQQAPGGSSEPDPLRNEAESGRLRATRFGPSCNLMGNVLGDPRWEQTPGATSEGEDSTTFTGVGVDFECYDLWPEGQPPRPFLPGQFFYRSNGPVIIIPDGVGPNPILPTEAESYALGCYGGPRNQGKDLLGRSNTIAIDSFRTTGAGSLLSTTGSNAAREGGPFSLAPTHVNHSASDYAFKCGNPIGVPDSIILVLTPGWDPQK